MTRRADPDGRTVLVTRAAHQAESTAGRLRDRGHRAVVAPLVLIDRLPARIDPGAQAILVTSRNGADALADATADRAVPVLAVGDATAAALREAGFARVRSANGDARALAALALAHLDPARGPVLHARGAEIRHSPLAVLREAGFGTGEAILYRTIALDTLPDAARGCDAALVHSPGSARRLVRVLHALPALRDVVAISDVALAPLRAASPTLRLHPAAHPCEEAMLDVLDALPP